jgi:hypothetical protein
MELPRLRLRKVFEHGTHFKVQKPGGQSITIAKKGLSPGTIKRYQRLAHGGEVRNYQIGGEVPKDETPEELDARLKAIGASLDASSASAPVAAPEALPVAAPARRVAVGTEAPIMTMREDAESMPAAPEQPKRLEARRAALEAKESAGELPGTAPVTPAAPAPVVVNVNAAPAPTPAVSAEPAPAPAPAPAPPAAVPVVARPPRQVPIETVPLPAAPVAEEAIPPVVMQAPPPVVPSKNVGLDAGSFTPLARPLDLKSSVEMPAIAPAAPPAAPVTALPAAPIAAPPAVAPTGLLTTERLRSGMAETPKATVAEVVQRIAPEAAPAIMATKPEIVSLRAADLAKPGGIADLFLDGLKNSINAAVEQGQAEKQAAEIEFEALEQQRIAIAEKAAKSIERKKELEAHLKQTRAEAEAADDLKSFIGGDGSSRGFWGSIGSVVALAIGGALSGYTKTPNYVLAAFNNAMERDLDEQKRRRSSLWQKYKTALGDDEAADEMLKAYNEQILAVALKQAAVKSGAQKIQPSIDKIIGMLEMSAAQHLATIEARLAQAEEDRRPPPPRVGRAPAGQSAATQFRKDKYERERTMNVAGVPVQRNTAAKADEVSKDLGNRNFMIDALSELSALFDKNPPEAAINIFTQTRSDMIAQLATSIELFPQGFGLNRAVTNVAKAQLKEALNSPTGFKQFMFAVIGDRDPATGVKTLLKEAQSSRRQFVMNRADPTSQRDRQAAELGLWRLESADAKITGKPVPKKPNLSLPENDLLTVPYFRQASAPPPAAGTASPTASTPAATPPTAGGDWRSRAKKL